MCGICGIVSLDGQAVEPVLMRRMTGALRHRGPDSEGLYNNLNVALGHARLSIIDAESGGQPMHNEDHTLCIVFNGEIFNYLELRTELSAKGHRFASRSDTEVILHLYEEEGDECVRRLNGQWAFAIWDARRQRLFLSRDRVGIQPLFYIETGDSFLFASEIKSLFASPRIHRELDLRALDQILTFWSTLPPRTMFRGVQQLPPGHSLVVDNRNVRIFEYWRLDYCNREEVAQDEDKLAEELLALLQDAIRIRLRSDVPVGAYLSGGLDSTLIAALARSGVGEGLRTFSVSFEDSEFDESRHQEEARTFLNVQHSKVHCSYADIARVFPDVIWHTEQPVLRAAPAPLFLLSNLVRNNGLKVVLTGEGADELMGGYDIFKETKIRQFWGRHPKSLTRPMLLKRLYPYMEGIQRQPVQYLGRFFHVTEEDLSSPYFSHLPRWNLTAQLKTFLSPAAQAEIPQNAWLSGIQQVLPASYKSWSAFRQAEYLETALLLPGYILSSQADRMTMAHSVEGRYPYLDHRVIEFSATLAPAVKMKALDEKRLLKRAAKGLVPESIRGRHKQPYRAPDGRSFFAAKSVYVDDMLSSANIRRDGIFDPARVTRLVQKFKSGRPTSVRDNMSLVGILSTEILIDRFINRSAFTSGEVLAS